MLNKKQWIDKVESIAFFTWGKDLWKKISEEVPVV